MSIQAQIDRINQNIANVYAILAAMGADIPAVQSSDNLAATAGTVKTVLYSPQNLNDAEKSQARTNIGALSTGGGTVTGPVEQETSGSSPARFIVSNDNGSVELTAHTSRGLYDTGNSKWVVQSGAGSADWSFHGNAKGLYETLPVEKGGTGKTSATAAFSVLSKCTTNGNWKTAPDGISLWRYEGADTETYGIPTGGCFVLVMKAGGGRGTAIALRWDGTNRKTYRSNLHDDTGSNKWSDWALLLDESGGTVSGNLTFGTWLGPRWVDAAGNTYLWRSSGSASSPYLQLMVKPNGGSDTEVIRINGSSAKVEFIRGITT